MLFTSKFFRIVVWGNLLVAIFLFATAHAQSNLVIRVLAANITSGNNQSYETAGINIFKGLKPDIVAIQEFKYNSSSSESNLRQLVDLAFGAEFHFFREPGSYSIPNGIISRWPILQSGSWNDEQVPDRGFAWALIDLPGTNDLYVVSVHLHGSGGSSSRATEANTLKALITTNFPPDAWVILGGDFNTTSRTESCLNIFKTFLSDDPIPTDLVSGGNPNTNEPRNNPYDYVLPSFSFAGHQVPVSIGSRHFTNGLVFDSEVYANNYGLADVAPVQSGDSHVSGMQHMAVVKDFLITIGAENNPPFITEHPESRSANLGDDVEFSVTAQGSGTLYYQWLFFGTNIFDATDSTLVLTNVQVSDAGEYSVIVTNAFGCVTSSVAVLTVDGRPVITSQPEDFIANAGDTAVFSVNAEGEPPLHYQWRFNSANIPGATGPTYQRLNVQPADAGNYSVVITNNAGSVTSRLATLTVNTGEPEIIAQWNFNSVAPDGSTATGSILPSIGNGTAMLIGGATATFATGDTTLDPAGSSDNSGWNTSTYPAQNSGNKSRGIQFTVSTAGKQNIVVSWSSQSSNTGSRYGRLQYSTNGVTFYDFPTAFTNGTSYTRKTNSLVNFPGANNNPNFAIRFVSEFENTAIGSGAAGYAAATSYGTSGTMRYDMITISGVPLSTPPPSPAILSDASYSGDAFQMAVSGQTGATYVVQSTTNLSNPIWISLVTNISPFTFSETNSSSAPEKFYRAVTK